MNWYVLYTASKAEKQVVQRLESFSAEVYLPLHYAPRKWSDRVKMVEVPLFSSYVFVKTTDEKLRNLLGVNGVSRIVYYNGYPAIVRESEIEAIKKFADTARGRACNYEINDELLIACGPFKDKTGKLLKVGKKYIVLHIEQLGLTVSLMQEQVMRRSS